MSGRILVAYASKTNAASQHAGAIAGALKGAGRDVDIVNLRETRKPDLAPYQAVVIGSGVRIGRWYGPARKLMKRKELAGKKVALFVACGMSCDEKMKSEAVEKLILPIKTKYNILVFSERAFPGLMPGAAKDKQVDITESQEWGRELAGTL